MTNRLTIAAWLILLAGCGTRPEYRPETYMSDPTANQWTPQDWANGEAQAHYARRIDAWLDLPPVVRPEFPEK